MFSSYLPLIVAASLLVASAPGEPVYPLPSIGIGVPLQTTPDAAHERPAEIPDGVAWTNWTANCVDRNQWPMVYSSTSPEPVGCDNHMLLLGNEGESPYQADDTPGQMAEMLRRYKDHPAGVYCCGSLSSERGWWYTMAVFGEYVYRYDSPPPIVGIHFHHYRHVSQPYDQELLARWRWLSEHFDVPIVLSEWAVEGNGQAQTAAAMEADLRALQDALGGRVWIALWFSWSYPQYELTDVRRDGAWTVVGDRWAEMVGQP